MLTTTKGSEQRAYTYNGDSVLVAQTADGMTTKHYIYGRERLYRATRDITKTWTLPITNWSKIRNQLVIRFQERFPL